MASRALLLSSPLALVLLTMPAAAQQSDLAPPYSGSASATVANYKVTIPGGILVDNIVDAGGPTAQVSGDSFGSAAGYAAFPDPGQLVVIAPGLATGLFAGGLAGLPPISLPTLPNYPLFISTDNGHPDASTGAGPYELRSHSDAGVANASAASGGQADSAGNVARVSAEAKVSIEHGKVVATSTARTEGVTIGPLMLGTITSTATETLDASGTVTPSTNIDISGATIGGLPVTIGPDGINAGGTPIPLPIGDTVTKLLASSGVTVEIMPAQTFDDRVIAPALRITYPFEPPPQIQHTGQCTMQVTLGFASAALTGSPPVTLPPVADTTAAPYSGAAVGATGIGSSVPTSGSTGGLGGTASAAVPVAPSDSSAVDGETVSERLPFELFDWRITYLTLWACGIAAWITNSLLRRLGVRRPWTSLDGSATNATVPSPSA